MKTSVLTLFLILFTIPVVSQTNNSIVFSTAQDKYQKIETAGVVLTAIGGGALLFGNIMYWKTYNNGNQTEPDEGNATTYKRIMFGGLGVMAVGIPLMVIGRTKLRHIEISASLIRYNGISSANGIGLSVRF
jgi:hypothetical protein